MSKRKTVKLNLDVVIPAIKTRCRSNVVFCELMGRPNQKTWVTEWGRNRNLPSPEEVVRMCAILQTTPEEILVEPADIELVQGLIDQQREAQKEKPLANSQELVPNMTADEWKDILKKMSRDQRKEVMDIIWELSNED